MKLPPSKSDPALEQKLADAAQRYENMSPLERAIMQADQRRSWVIGQCGRDPGEDVLVAEIRRLRVLIEGTLAHKAQWSDDLTIKEQLAYLYNGNKDWRPK